MANNWPVVKFGTLYKEPSRNGLTKPKKVRGKGLKFINMGEIFRFDRMYNIPCDRVPVTDKEKSANLLQAGDLLFARQSLILSGAGKCSIFLGDEEDIVFESHLIRVRLDIERVNPEYAYYYFLSPQGRSRIAAIVEQGAGQAGIRGTDLQNLDFPLPPKSFQDYLVSIVCPCDLKIELNKQKNQTLEQMAQALFKSWFVDFGPVFDNAFDAGLSVDDLPDELQQRAMVRQQHRFEAMQQDSEAIMPQTPQSTAVLQPQNQQAAQTESDRIRGLFPNEFEQCDDPSVGINGWIPKGWKIKSVDDLNRINPESWTKKNTPKNVMYVDLANAKNGTILEPIEYSFEDAPSRARRVLQKHDIIIGVVRPANRSFAYVNENGLTGSTGFAVVRALNDSYRAFTYLTLTNDDSITEFARIADGAAYPAIKPEDVAKATCLYSSDELLESFEKIVGQLLLKKAANEQQLKPLGTLRDTLLPKLISGELQLSETVQSIETK
mgnify:CR=1 FL=1|tara:strand:- start:3549 stop:5030 length:1482 start_codon:yes stop_codon:yes gene_type:complete